MSEKIIRKELPTFLNQSFISYAMSVITDRALADSRDGLKPVHRRNLLSMYELKLWASGSHRKCARIVGDTMGKRHPHGDSSIYGGLVSLAQPFTMRYPLVDSHGNFGNIDGDSPAAMRYTEAKLSRIGELMVTEMAKDTYDEMDNFDATLKEAVYLPTLFANVICNGSIEGIAVGMASKMVPHNLTETYNALIACIDLLKNQETPTVATLMEHMQGPDFPLGATLIGRKGIYDYFETGRGKLTLRCKYDIQSSSKGEKIIITEIPFKVNKQRMVEKIEALMEDKIKEIRKVEDHTDREGLSIVISLKKNVNTQTVIQKLCKFSDFQIKLSVNNNLLYNGVPRVTGMVELMTQFIEHAKLVVARRMEYDLNKKIDRSNHLQILLWGIAYADTIIPIIRQSDSTDDVMLAIQEIWPEVLPEQAKIIGGINLRQLSAGNVTKFESELETVNQEIAQYQTILADNALLLEEVKEEFIQIRDKFGDARRTVIEAEEHEIILEDLIDDEELVMTYTTDHLIRTCSEKEFRATKRGAKGVSNALNNEESLKYMLSISNKDTLMFFTSRGRCHTLKAYTLPKTARTAKGRSIHNFLNLEEDETILNVINMKANRTEADNAKCLVFVTRQGVIKKLSLEKLSTVRNVTKVMSFKDEDMLISANLAEPNQEFVICTAHGMANRFDLESIRPMGREAAGVTGIKFKVEGDYVVDATPVDSNHRMLTITKNGYGKLSEFESIRKSNRGAKGVTCHKTGDSHLAAMLSVDNPEQENVINELLIATAGGQMIRINANQIRECGRNARGVKLVQLQSEDTITAVSLKQSEVELLEP